MNKWQLAWYIVFALICQGSTIFWMNKITDLLVGSHK